MSDLLKTRITEDLKNAMRAQDKVRVAAMRLLTAEIKQREVDERIVLDNQAIIAVIDKMISQRMDSLKQYQSAGRADLAEQEAFEIGMLKEYLPEPFSSQEITRLIHASIAALGACSIKDMGAVMADLKPKVQGRADMGALSGLVKDLLSKG